MIYFGYEDIKLQDDRGEYRRAFLIKFARLELRFSLEPKPFIAPSIKDASVISDLPAITRSLTDIYSSPYGPGGVLGFLQKPEPEIPTVLGDSWLCPSCKNWNSLDHKVCTACGEIPMADHVFVDYWAGDGGSRSTNCAYGLSLSLPGKKACNLPFEQHPATISPKKP